jgi:hypothetical protein
MLRKKRLKRIRMTRGGTRWLVDDLPAGGNLDRQMTAR